MTASINMQKEKKRLYVCFTATVRCAQSESQHLPHRLILHSAEWFDGRHMPFAFTSEESVRAWRPSILLDGVSDREASGGDEDWGWEGCRLRANPPHGGQTQRICLNYSWWYSSSGLVHSLVSWSVIFQLHQLMDPTSAFHSAQRSFNQLSQQASRLLTVAFFLKIQKVFISLPVLDWQRDSIHHFLLISSA